MTGVRDASHRMREKFSMYCYDVRVKLDKWMVEDAQNVLTCANSATVMTEVTWRS